MAGAAATQVALTVPLLHRFRGIGLVLVAMVFLVLRSLGIPHILESSDSASVVAYALAGAGAVLVAIALLVFKPRVPDRQPGQSVEAYWKTPEVAAMALRVWFLLEGGALMAAMGYFMTGQPGAAAAMVAAVAVFWLFGPNVFAKG